MVTNDKKQRKLAVWEMANASSIAEAIQTVKDVEQVERVLALIK